jgi:hypothetical protein
MGESESEVLKMEESASEVLFTDSTALSGGIPHTLFISTLDKHEWSA